MNPIDPQRVDGDTLTQPGETRRVAILADALRAADRRRRTRVAGRAALAACAAVLVATPVVWLLRDTSNPAGELVVVRPQPQQTTRPIVTESAPTPRVVVPPRARPRVVVEVIPGDRIERRWEVLDDRQLLAALADAGRPSGLARINGESLIIPVQ